MKTKNINTDKISVSISKDINKKLSDYCEEKLINKSKLINKLIGNFLDQIFTEKNKKEYVHEERN